ncbi:integumentary mucin C.1-like [Drosophila sulfurigaster albostrigata]|uniref:integumentary mucin C.1-like n=1 Tax=Drosophila sulfurigaster albostrigata TaxID=89887 RepID=UPI002D219E62|nr:integumentary mucin C.1-like [Drosophila sulfurigaster albostrigata]
MLLKLFISLLLVQYSIAICDVCQSGKAACHSKNTYSICIAGVPTLNFITCPAGYTCTGEKFICYPESKGYQPICNPSDDGLTTQASTIPTTSTTLTTPTTTYTPTTTTTPTTVTTPTTITTPRTTTPTTPITSTTPRTTSTPTTTTTQTTTTTSTPITTPASTTTTEDTSSETFCQKNGNGNYVNENDSSCKTFLRCYRGRETITDCQPVNNIETYFNGDKCTPTKPDYCT